MKPICVPAAFRSESSTWIVLLNGLRMNSSVCTV